MLPPVCGEAEKLEQCRVFNNTRNIWGIDRFGNLDLMEVRGEARMTTTDIKARSVLVTAAYDRTDVQTTLTYACRNSHRTRVTWVVRLRKSRR